MKNPIVAWEGTAWSPNVKPENRMRLRVVVVPDDAAVPLAHYAAGTKMTARTVVEISAFKDAMGARRWSEIDFSGGSGGSDAARAAVWILAEALLASCPYMIDGHACRTRRPDFDRRADDGAPPKPEPTPGDEGGEAAAATLVRKGKP